jgi:TadE-like protein
MLKQISKLKQLATDTTGQEVAEAALVLPIAFMILLGVFWFGRAYNIYATVTHAAAEGARVAASPTCATCGNAVPTDTAVTTAVNTILQASKLDTTQVAAYVPTPAPVPCPGFPACPPLPSPTPGTEAIYICRNVELNDPALSTPQICGTLVSFQYPFQVLIPFTAMNFQIINLPGASKARLED